MALSVGLDMVNISVQLILVLQFVVGAGGAHGLHVVQLHRVSSEEPVDIHQKAPEELFSRCRVVKAARGVRPLGWIATDQAPPPPPLTVAYKTWIGVSPGHCLANGLRAPLLI